MAVLLRIDGVQESPGDLAKMQVLNQLGLGFRALTCSQGMALLLITLTDRTGSEERAS